MDNLSDESRQKILSILGKDAVTKADILSLSKVPVLQDDGTYKIADPEYDFYTEILLQKNTLANQSQAVLTTVGRAIANKVLLVDVFGDKIPYINTPFKLSDIQGQIVNLLMNQEASVSQFGDFQTAVSWFNQFGDILIPSPSAAVLSTPDSVKKLKKKLVEENQDIIQKGDVSFVDKVEKPLIEAAVNELKDDPSWPLYAKGGKPSIGNNLKSMTIVNGLIYDPVEAKFHTSLSSLQEGMDPEEYNYIANQMIVGTYNRAVNTKIGGAMTKKVLSALNVYQALEAGSDCGTKMTKRVIINRSEENAYLWNNIVEGGKIVTLTPDNIKSYFGKEVNMRTPLFCQSKGFHICNACLGELVYKLNLTNIGILAMRITSTILNMSLKSFHDSNVKTIKLNPLEYMKFAD